MPEFKDVVKRIDKRLWGDPLQVAGYELQTEARLTGWAGGVEPGGGGAWLKLTPIHVYVREPDGTNTTVRISDPQPALVRGTVIPALTVAGVGIVMMMAARLWRAR